EAVALVESYSSIVAEQQQLLDMGQALDQVRQQRTADPLPAQCAFHDYVLDQRAVAVVGDCARESHQLVAEPGAQADRRGLEQRPNIFERSIRGPLRLLK